MNTVTTNIVKKFLRLLGMVWAVAISILFFAILFLRLDLIQDILASTPVIGVICIVIGTAIGFIAGAIVCYLNTVKAVDARNKKISKLQNTIASLNEDYTNACHALAQIYPQYEKKIKRQQKKEKDEQTSQIFSQIADLSETSEEPVLPEEEINQDEVF